MGDHPPEILSERLLHVVGINRKEEGKQDVLAVVLHFGFGASIGAVFRAAAPHPASADSSPSAGYGFRHSGLGGELQGLDTCPGNSTAA